MPERRKIVVAGAGPVGVVAACRPALQSVRAERMRGSTDDAAARREHRVSSSTLGTARAALAQARDGLAAL